MIAHYAQPNTGESIRCYWRYSVDTTSDAEGNITINATGFDYNYSYNINVEKVGSTEPQLTIKSETNTGGFGTGILDIFNNYRHLWTRNRCYCRSNGTHASSTAS